LGEKDGFHLVECKSCQLRQVANVPSNAELDEYYSHWHMNDKYARQAKKKVWRWLPKLLKARLKTGGGTFLDVGCNAGFAVEAARRLGFSAHGIEVSDETIAAARSLFPANHFETISIQDHAKMAPQYDLVLCSEVVEHLNSVHNFLDALCAVIRPGGLLLLTTPDGDAFANPADFTKWKDVNPPQHLLWFRKRHLIEQMAKRGLHLQWQQYTKKPSLRLMFGKGD
jgi:2-polyprenyl-3-methyl-5-hydroxy-6-metoxy-1,4-benzoquinol methylase